MKYRIFFFFVELYHWLLFFLSPVFASAFITIIIISTGVVSLSAFYISLPVGILVGIFFAERIRRKYGCANYWSTQYGTGAP